MGKQRDLPRMFPFAARLPPLAAPSVYVQVLGLPAPASRLQAPPELTLKCRFTSSVAAEDDAALVIGLVVERRCIGGGAVDPGLDSLRLVEKVRDVADLRDRQMLDRTGRGLAGHRRDLRAAALGYDEAACAGAFRDAGNGAEVARILDLVEHHDKRVVRFQQGLGAGVWVGPDF